MKGEQANRREMPVGRAALIASVGGAIIAVGVAHVLRGPAKAQEAAASGGTPLSRRV